MSSRLVIPGVRHNEVTLIILTFFVMFSLDVDESIDGVNTPAVLPLLVGGLLGYLLGSIPTAFLLVRWKSRVDIRESGSGNVGTLNSYQVSGSKIVGIIVLVADFLKGFLAVWGAAHLFGNTFEGIAAAGVGSVLGHNFPVWLRFRGGRGLATGAGVFSYLSVTVVVVWVAWWIVGFIPLRKVNIANVIATLGLLLLLWVLPDATIQGIMGEIGTLTGIRLFGTCILAILLIGHGKPLAEYLAERRVQKTH